MNKQISKILIILSLVIAVFAVSGFNANASAAITYNFYNAANTGLDNVNALVYDCQDSRCASVTVPSFKNTGNSNDYAPNTDLTITYPTNLETQYGYAVYYYREGYLPVESFANWHGTGSTTQNVIFHQKADCSSHIENFQIINADQPNLPIQIHVKAKLDATTYSAFSSNPNTPEYVPTQYKDFYSAETQVTLQIVDSSNHLVYAQSKNLNLYMDSSDEVNFEWVPSVSGIYKAVITTDVTDNQCSSQVSQSVQSNFSVVRNSLDKCYTLLNNLITSVVEPNVNENVQIKINKISNYRAENGDLTAIATNADLKIYDSNNNIVKQETRNIARNVNTVDPVEFSFNWTPTAKGYYTIQVHGIANDSLCNGKENLDETETMNSIVNDNIPPDNTYLNLRTINNKEVYENHVLRFSISSDYNGVSQLVFSANNLPSGATFNPLTHEFYYNPSYDTVSHSSLVNQILNLFGVDTLSKDFQVTFKVTDGKLSDQEVVRIRVDDVNRNPVLNKIADITINEGETIKITPSASDSDGDSIVYKYGYPLNLIGEWTTKTGDKGIYYVTIMAYDGFGGQAQQSFRIIVQESGNPIILEPIDNHELKLTALHLENDVIKAGNDLVVYTNIRNDGNLNEDQIKLRVTIPEIGIVEQKTINNLQENDQRSRIFIITIPENTKPGYYALKSQVFNGNSEETEAIEFKVV